ncbi:hypothetical protein AB5I39_02915 [Sphingomonas sp. MMS24-J45]|uniref:hypothetical protein n=1 Tax=Sphingomonas sp. MMS24-J45 TaxID=3238806 RepID=UPI00384B5C8C
MTVDVAGVLRDAWVMAKRDREMLIGVAGALILVPAIAQEMFVTAPPPLPASGSDTAALQAWIEAATIWSRQNDLLLFGLSLVAVFGALVLFWLYTDRTRPSVGEALSNGIAFLPRYVLLALCIALPVNIGTLLLLIPGLYLKGRLLPVGPIFVAERPIGVFAAWRRSFAMTRGNGLILMALACVPLLGGDLLAMPFKLLGQSLDGAPMANPVVAAVLDCVVGVCRTVGVVASILIEVALYRRLSKGM